MEQVFRSILENALAACPDPVRVEVRCQYVNGPPDRGSGLRSATTAPA